MKRKPKQYSLTIFLSKKGVSRAACLNKEKIKDFEATLIPLSKGLDGLLYIYSTETKRPEWVTYLSGGLDEKGFRRLSKLIQPSLSNSGALVIKIPGTRRFAVLTFGYGKSLVEYESVEQYFGRNVVLNSAKLERILSIKSQSYHRQPRHKEDQASITTSFYDFELDLENEILQKLTAEYNESFLNEHDLKNGELGLRVTGYDSLSVTTSLPIPRLHKLSKWLCSHFESDRYKTLLPYIDSFLQVKDPTLIEDLDRDLLNLLTKKKLERVNLVVPFLIDHSEYNHFTVTGLGRAGKNRLSGEFPPIENIVNLIHELGLADDANLSIDDLKQKYKLLCLSNLDEARNRGAKLYRAITAEVEHKSDFYSLMGGKWYKVDRDFFDRLVTRLNKSVGPCSIQLDAFDEEIHTDEKGYNISQAEKDGLQLFDRKTITLRGKGAIEVCDLLSESAELIHVKRYQGSADLSHLFSQGYVSIKSLIEDEEFRQKFLSKVSPRGLQKNIEKAIEKKTAKVIFVILMDGSAHKRPEKKIQNLPAFSVVNSNKFIRDISTMGFSPKIHFVFREQDAIAPH